jgi:hypothetical protein
MIMILLSLSLPLAEIERQTRKSLFTNNLSTHDTRALKPVWLPGFGWVRVGRRLARRLPLSVMCQVEL